MHVSSIVAGRVLVNYLSKKIKKRQRLQIPKV